MRPIAGSSSSAGAPDPGLMASQLLAAWPIAAEDLVAISGDRTADVESSHPSFAELPPRLAETRIGLFEFSESTCTEPLVFASSSSHRACRWWGAEVTAETRVFLSQDAWRGNSVSPPRLHRYAYALNAPMNWIDPDGREAVSPRTLLLIGAGLSVFIAFGAALKSDSYDKWAHFSAGYGLAVLLIGVVSAATLSRNGGKVMARVFWLDFIINLGIEWLVTGPFEIRDFAAQLVGSMLAALIYFWKDPGTSDAETEAYWWLAVAGMAQCLASYGIRFAGQLAKQARDAALAAGAG